MVLMVFAASPHSALILSYVNTKLYMHWFLKTALSGLIDHRAMNCYEVNVQASSACLQPSGRDTLQQSSPGQAPPGSSKEIAKSVEPVACGIPE